MTTSSEPRLPEGFSEPRPDCRLTRLLPHIAGHINSAQAPVRVLDYGCGEGYLAQFLNEKVNLHLFDIETRLLELAHSNALRSKISELTVHRDPSSIPQGSFDFVILSLVLVAIPAQAVVDEVMINCVRALKPKGKLILATTHPCFRDKTFSTFHTQYSDGARFAYSQSGVGFNVYLSTSDPKDSIKLLDTHRTLGWYSTLLQSHGFSTLAVEEVYDDPDLIPNRFNPFFPPFISFVAQRHTP